MSRRSRAKREGFGKLLGVLLGFVAIVVLIAMGGAAWWLRKTKEPLDAENCPRSGPRSIHVIMIDRSDPISGQQAQRIRQTINKAKNDAPFARRFDVYTFEGDAKNEMTPILRVCAPGRPEDANEFIENPDLIRRRYEERFSSVLDKTIDELLREQTRPNSPIIESLRAASITSFGQIVAGKTPLQVTLVSDIIQHSTATSHFKAEPNFAQLSKLAVWPAVQPILKGADIDILYLLRPSAVRGGAAIQTRGHQLFWEQLIGASGGRLNSIQPL